MALLVSTASQTVGTIGAVVTGYPYTISTWVKFVGGQYEHYGSDPICMAWWSAGPVAFHNTHFKYEADSLLVGENSVALSPNYSETMTFLNDFNSKKWFLLTTVRTATRIHTYINSFRDTITHSVGYPTSASIMSIVLPASTSATAFEMYVAEFSMWNVALTRPEIKTLARGNSAEFLSDRSSNLVYHRNLESDYSTGLVGAVDMSGGSFVSDQPRIITLPSLSYGVDTADYSRIQTYTLPKRTETLITEDIRQSNINQYKETTNRELSI